MANPPTRYIYWPLSSVHHTRIIELEPSENPSWPLRCRLAECELNAAAPYEALSYAWGPPNFVCDLFVDGSTLRITPSLWSALHRFRLPNQVRRIWADAVCINQNDDVEKGTQIPLMSDIYRGASRVVVWLGSTRDESMAWLNAHGHRIDRLRKDLAARIYASELSDEAMGLFSEIRSALEDLAFLPWFSRRWILQEVALNPDVKLCCGEHEMSWTRLAMIAKDVMFIISRTETTADSTGLGGFVSLDAMIKLWKSFIFDRQGVNVRQLLVEFDQFQCSDGRDRIYALMGLSAGRPLMAADYTRSTEETYNSFAEALLRAEPYVFTWFLEQAEARQTSQRALALASWAPDWRVPQTVRPLSHLFEGYPNNYLQIRFDRQHHALTFNGMGWIARQYLPRTGMSIRGMLPSPRRTSAYSKTDGAPLSIDWKSEPLSPTADTHGVLVWLQSVLRRCCDGLQLHRYIKHQSILRPQSHDNLCAIALAWTIMGAVETVADDSGEGRRVILNRNSIPDLQWLPPMPRRDDHYPYSLDPDHRGFLEIFQGILRSQGQRVRSAELVDLIRDMMQNRCIFTCVARSSDDQFHVTEILGIGNKTLEMGDRIISFRSTGRRASAPRQIYLGVDGGPGTESDFTKSIRPFGCTSHTYIVGKAPGPAVEWKLVCSCRLTVHVELLDMYTTEEHGITMV